MADDETEDQFPDQAEGRFAENLRAAREHAGLSQDALAEQMRELGYTVFRQQTVASIEGGSRSVRLGEALALSQITRTDISSLVRPRGMLREAWGVVDAARIVREQSKALGDNALRLSNARKRLEEAMIKVEQAGLGDALSDEMYIGRRASGIAMLGALQALAEELLTPARWGDGRTLMNSERQFAIRIADTLLALAQNEEARPPSFQEESVSPSSAEIAKELDAMRRPPKDEAAG